MSVRLNLVQETCVNYLRYIDWDLQLHSPSASKLSTGIRPRDLFFWLQAGGKAPRLRDERQGQAQQLLGEVICVGRQQLSESLLDGSVIHVAVEDDPFDCLN